MHKQTLIALTVAAILTLLLTGPVLGQDCSIVDGEIVCKDPPPIIWHDVYLPIIISP